MELIERKKNFRTKVSRVTFLSVGGRVIVYEHQRKMSSNPAQNVIKIYFKGNLMGQMEQKTLVQKCHG